MIINKPSETSQQFESMINSDHPSHNDPEVHEGSTLLKSSMKTENTETSNKQDLMKNLLFSWKKFKDSTTEFLNSNSEIYQNVTTTVNNFQINEEILNSTDSPRRANSMFEAYQNQQNNISENDNKEVHSLLGDILIGEKHEKPDVVFSFQHMGQRDSFVRRQGNESVQESKDI